MAGRGPAPKQEATRQRRNKKASAVVLGEAAKVKAPTLPKLTDRKWETQTKSEWTAIWKSPMAGQYDATDTAGLLKLIVLVDDYWKAENAAERNKLSAEIRLQRLEFGLTPVARLRLQWEVAKNQEQEAKAAKRQPKEAKADPRDNLHTETPAAGATT